MPNRSIVECLKTEILVTDGAMGTRFYEKGVPLTQCYEELNSSDPALVASLHREYVEAGARIIQANTFGANRSKLEPFGLGSRVHEINLAGARIARNVAAKKVFVSGSIGPIAHPKDPSLRFSEDQILDMYREQAKGLFFGGVDLITLETFPGLRDLKLAYQAVREIAPKILIIPQVAYVEVARTANGERLPQVVKTCEALGAKALGANCGMGPHHMIQITRQLAEQSSLPIVAVPNAGYPEYHEGRIRYLTTAEYMGECAIELVKNGANILGGCCGTSPEHVAAMVDAVEDMKPVKRDKLVPAVMKRAETKIQESHVKKWDILRDLNKRLLWTVEIDPPIGLDIEKVMKGAETFKQVGIDGINIAENPLGRSRMSTTVLGNLIQEKFDLPAIVHITGRDRNVIGLQSELLGAGLCNIASILAITGDPTSAGDYPWAKSVFDVNSFGLVELISKLNTGSNLAGHSIDRPTDFSIGVAFNASKARMENEVKRLERKISCGAHYAQTQPLYDKERILELLEKTEHTQTPIFIGILPVISYRNAEFLHNEFPGIFIPDKTRDALRKCKGDKKEEKKVSIELMSELMLSVADKAKGFYVVPQFNHFKMARTIIENVRDS